MRMPALPELPTPARIGAFAAGLLVVFAAGTGIGAAVSPIGNPAPAHSSGGTSPSHSTEHTP